MIWKSSHVILLRFEKYFSKKMEDLIHILEDQSGKNDTVFSHDIKEISVDSKDI